MDARKTGNFISERRKSLGFTQAQLAELIHVTDKAVSRWERGVGLPDINSVEPLAEALQVSVVEVMRGETVHETMTVQDTSDVVKEVISMAEKKRAERRAVCVICVTALLLTALVLLVDNLGGLFLVGVYLPMFGIFGGITMIAFAIYRKKRNLPCKAMVIAAVFLLLIPVVWEIFLVVGFLMGGGAPS